MDKSVRIINNEAKGLCVARALAFLLCNLTLFTSFILSSSLVSATNSVSHVSSAAFTVSESCFVTGTVDTPHVANLVNGVYSGVNYASGIGLTTIKAFCNDNAGFAIYAIGYTNDEYGNTVLHWDGASGSNDTTNAINTGVYISGTTMDSTWSMKLASVAGAYPAVVDDGVSVHNNSTEDFTNWHVVPSEYERVAYRLGSTDVEPNGNATGSSVTVTYDTYISQTQAAGTYIGQVKFTLVHPNTAIEPPTPLVATDCPQYSICYAPNDVTVDGDMSSIGTLAAYAAGGKQTLDDSGNTIDSNTTSVTLIAPNYKRDSYGFAGWSTDYVATNSSTIYGPNQTITLGSGSGYDADISTNGLILYPVWVA